MISRYESIPTPEELQKILPAKERLIRQVLHSRNLISQLLQPNASKRILIIGPCSIHNITETLSYATLLRQLQESLSHFYLVMRVYFEKPRTSLGWKGFLYDPHLDGSYDLKHGLIATRKLLLELADMDVPIATEFLEPGVSLYFQDLVSWGCVGARTSSSQIHRQLASSLPMPIGFKNTPSGSIKTAVNGMVSSFYSHSFFGINAQGILSKITSSGNKDAHLVLRGGKEPNFDTSSVNLAINLIRQANLKPSLLIDCSHDNSRRLEEAQVNVFQSVMQQCLEKNPYIRGALLESYLEGGRQAFPEPNSSPLPGISLTDACLSFETTKEMILAADLSLKKALSYEPLPSLCAS